MSENHIAFMGGLSILPRLSSLNVSKNALSSAEGVAHLAKCRALSTVDLSHNDLGCGKDGKDDSVVNVLSRIPSLLSLNVAGNSIVSELSSFRKKVLVGLQNLSYLDQPVFNRERASAEAWTEGGREAELRTKKMWQKRKKDEDRASIDYFRHQNDAINSKAEELIDSSESDAV